MNFRHNSGSLEESMASKIEVIDIEELKYILNDFYDFCPHKIEEIKFKYVCFDKRTGWDTYYVLARFESSEDFKVVGMSDSEF